MKYFIPCCRSKAVWSKANGEYFDNEKDCLEHMKRLYHTDYCEIKKRKNIDVVVARNPFGLTLPEAQSPLNPESIRPVYVEIGALFDTMDDKAVLDQYVDIYLDENFHNMRK